MLCLLYIYVLLGVKFPGPVLKECQRQYSLFLIRAQFTRVGNGRPLRCPSEARYLIDPVAWPTPSCKQLHALVRRKFFKKL